MVRAMSKDSEPYLFPADELRRHLGFTLTKEDLDKMSEGECPYCAHKGFQLGPRGGAAQSIRCMGCDRKYNVVTMGWRVVMGSTIPPEFRFIE